jgi:hypothetical protein
MASNIDNINNVTDNILQIINKHKGAVLQAAFMNFEKETLRVHRGILRNMNKAMIQLSSDGHPSGSVNLKFFENNKKNIICIYNKNFSELLSLKKGVTLNVKLRKPENQKKIIKNIKPYMGKVVSIVFKKMEQLQVVTGEFADMGIIDITVKPAPFFNSTQRLSYGSILNVYTEQGYDLLEID